MYSPEARGPDTCPPHRAVAGVHLCRGADPAHQGLSASLVSEVPPPSCVAHSCPWAVGATADTTVEATWRGHGRGHAQATLSARPTGRQQGSFPRPGGLRDPRWHADHPTQQHAHPARAPRWRALLFSVHQRPPHTRPALSSASTPQPLRTLPSGLPLSCPRASTLAHVHSPPVALSACPCWHPLLRRCCPPP